MTPRQIALVQRSFHKLTPDTTAKMFYARLFSIAPHLERMFQNDIESQGRMLMAVLERAVYALDELESLLPALEALGVRHATYGVQPHHYDLVGAALLWTLSEGLGIEFTPQVEQAWTEAYGTLASAMMAAAATQAA